MQTQQPTVTIPVSTLDKVSHLMRAMLSVVEELKTQAGPDRFVPSQTILDDAGFEKMSEELESAFADLNDQDLDTLTTEAVIWARHQKSA